MRNRPLGLFITPMPHSTKVSVRIEVRRATKHDSHAAIVAAIRALRKAHQDGDYKGDKRRLIAQDLSRLDNGYYERDGFPPGTGAE